MNPCSNDNSNNNHRFHTFIHTLRCKIDRLQLLQPKQWSSSYGHTNAHAQTSFTSLAYVFDVGLCSLHTPEPIREYEPTSYTYKSKTKQDV